MQHSPPLTHLETIKSHTFVKRFCIPVPVLALVSINKQFVRCALASPSSFVTVRFDVRSDLLPGMEHRAAPCPQEEVCFRHGNIREGRTSLFQGLKKRGKTKKRHSKKMQSFHLFLEKCPISRRKNKHFIYQCIHQKKQGFHLETSKMFLQQKKCNTFETAHQKRRCLLLHLFLKKSSFQKKYVLRTTDPSSKITLKKHHNEKMTQVWAYE